MDSEPAAAFTLADMVNQAEDQAAQTVMSAVAARPLETVGSKGGVPGLVVSNRSEPGDSVSGDIVAGPASHEAVAPESYLERLSRMVAGFQDDLRSVDGDRPAGRDVVPGQTAAATGDAPTSLTSAANEPSVPDELVFRLHARSASGDGQDQQVLPPDAPAVTSSESAQIWSLVAAAPDAAGRSAATGVDLPLAKAMPQGGAKTRLSDLVDAGGAPETPQGRSNSQPAVEPARGGRMPRFQATGLTLAEMAADMAMVPTPAPAKQAATPSAPATISLARFALPPAKPVPDARRTARSSLVFRLPGAGLGQLGPRAERRRVLRFPDPRDLGTGRDSEVLQYPASASLSRFLGGIETLPAPSRRLARGRSRGGRSVMPVNLNQVARRIDWARAASAAAGSRPPYRSFSFSSESFAGNQQTTGSQGDQGTEERRRAVMHELRGVFAPAR